MWKLMKSDGKLKDIHKQANLHPPPRFISPASKPFSPYPLEQASSQTLSRSYHIPT